MTPTNTRENAGTARTVVVREHAGRRIIHDPLTGLTHACRRYSALGRVQLDDTELQCLPVVHPGDFQATAPISVCWSPLVRCNLACPYCLDDKSVRELPQDERLHIARVLAESEVLGVDISGGEPLLLRDLPDLLDVLVANGCAVSVTTNGTHLARRAQTLAGRVDAIRVSLDGPDSNLHDRWRGRGSFDRAVAGIRASVAYGVPTQIQTVIMRSTTRTSLQETIRLAAALGARGVTFLQMLPIGEGKSLAEAEQLEDYEARDLVRHLDTAGMTVRLRTREAAGGFTVVRADGQVWRNQPGSTEISSIRPLRTVQDLNLSERDGSA
ncbi:radical SAM protein [Amycolatopsis sp. NPDC059657]|uniref:radical SAM protein n=1 Tax=Amycolatopsis sp. NPDC059657 TaxID=3346899 RepID=UPI0036711333